MNGEIKVKLRRGAKLVNTRIYHKPHKHKDELLSRCPYCGDSNVCRYPHRQGMCTSCGKIYENFRQLKYGSRRYREVVAYYEEQKKKGYKVPKYKSLEQADIIEEETRMTEKVCKQCGQKKSVDAFRKNAARGKGIYNTKQGHHNYCKECESINVRAIALEKIVDKTPDEQALYSKLKMYYEALYRAGLGASTAVAQRYIGKTPEAEQAASTIEDRLDAMIGLLAGNKVMDFMTKLRNREFVNPDAAWAQYDALKESIDADGYKDEVYSLIDEWEEENGYN